jgi:hypothetical protein
MHAHILADALRRHAPRANELVEKAGGDGQPLGGIRHRQESNRFTVTICLSGGQRARDEEGLEARDRHEQPARLL